MLIELLVLVYGLLSVGLGIIVALISGFVGI
jgi:hypothetical protein